MRKRENSSKLFVYYFYYDSQPYNYNNCLCSLKTACFPRPLMMGGCMKLYEITRCLHTCKLH